MFDQLLDLRFKLLVIINIPKYSQIVESTFARVHTFNDAISCLKMRIDLYTSIYGNFLTCGFCAFARQVVGSGRNLVPDPPIIVPLLVLDLVMGLL